MHIARQISVFLENKPGALAKMCDALAERDVNIVALSVGDTADYAVVRLLTSDPDTAVHVIGEAGTLVVECDVVVVDLENRVGSLAETARKLSRADINIDYAYGSATEDQPAGMLVLRTQDPQETLKALS